MVRLMLCGALSVGSMGSPLADAEGGWCVVAVPADVAFAGGVVDELVVDACEGFGLTEGDHVWVEGVDGFGGH